MKDNRTTLILSEDCSIQQNSVPVKMLIACFFSCILGIVLMAVSSHYLLMAILIGITACLFVTTLLHATRQISLSTACLVPMLLICFLYTPASWFTFDGLLGSTPYFSILYITIITLTHYHKTQIIVVSLYGALMLGLIIHWLLTWTGETKMEQIGSILFAYFFTAVLNYFIIESVKRKNIELNKYIMNLSLHDDLTGLLNRRAIEDIIVKLEDDFKNQSAEYAVVMLDVDKFKSINDLHGHHLGDSVLQNMASSILKSIRPEDFAFRLGGDEFLLLLPNGDKQIADKIYKHISAEVQQLDGDPFPLTVSYGYALRSEGASTTEVLALADQRMYDNKRGSMKDKKSGKI